VSSPGIERPLRTERDYIRFSGHKAKLKLRDAIAGGSVAGAGLRVVVGTIESVTDGSVRVSEGDRSHDVPLSNVERARLIFEFGSGSKQPH
jgi:ribosome maturation factor RimP